MANAEVVEKKYRILQSFNYYGKDGKDLTHGIRLGPAEPVPELNDELHEDLLAKNIICEISDSGENLLRKIKDTQDLIELNETQLRHLLPSPQTIKYLKHNKLTRQSLHDLEYLINDSIIKLGLKPNYYIEETQKLINEQIHNLNVSNDEGE